MKQHHLSGAGVLQMEALGQVGDVVVVMSLHIVAFMESASNKSHPTGHSLLSPSSQSLQNFLVQNGILRRASSLHEMQTTVVGFLFRPVLKCIERGMHRGSL